MATAMAERDREKYRRPGDVIEHIKKYRAYDFYGTLDLGQADKWIKTVEKACTTLQLSNEENMSNVYGLIFNKADDWLTRIENIYGEALNWQVLQEEFHREYLTENY